MVISSVLVRNLHLSVESRPQGAYARAMIEPTRSEADQIFELIATLRGEGGCPWDREQRLGDVLSDLIEEAYELHWAALQNGPDVGADILDEMGDVFFLLCFAIAIRRESDAHLTLEKISLHAHRKIVARHPHVFGDAVAKNIDESVAHWERMKAKERAARGVETKTLDDVAGNLPSLRHARKVQERAAAVGFDWDDVSDVVAKLREEVDELEQAIADKDRDAVVHELGDVIFSAVNVARFVNVEGDAALDATTARFIDRFHRMETLILSEEKSLADMPLSEMDVFWERAKKQS